MKWTVESTQKLREDLEDARETIRILRHDNKKYISKCLVYKKALQHLHKVSRGALV